MAWGRVLSRKVAGWSVRVPWPKVFGLFALLIAAVAAGYLVFGPIADAIARHDIETIVGRDRGAALQKARDAARGRLLTFGAGLFAAGALVYTARNFRLSRRTFELAEQGQVTDRYTTAIEQLGSEKLDVRIGGIYALGRVALDSDTDYPTVMEVLATFVREHSHEDWIDPGDPEELRDPPESPAKPPTFRQRLAYVLTDRIIRAIDILSLQNIDAPQRMRRRRTDDPRRRVRPDIQAALTVIGRRNPRRDPLPLNLGLASLIRANLVLAYLPGMNMAFADLTRSNLYGADLTGAVLIQAKLIGTTVSHTDFSNAILVGANFAHAQGLDRAILAGADLDRALWPVDAVVPKGWQRDTTLGRLKRASTNSTGRTTGTHG